MKRVELYIAELLVRLEDEQSDEDFDETDIHDRAGGNVNDAYDYGFDDGYDDGEYHGKKSVASKIKAIIDGEDE